MKLRIAVAIVLFGISLTAGAQQETIDWPKPDVRPGRSRTDIDRAIVSYAQALFDTNHFSGVVLVAKDGQPVLQRAWGLADVASKTPNTLDTKFNIGSINKMFTKVAIAQLAESGKLSIDDTVRKFLPDYPSPVADRITIRQLVTHRSGLGDFFGDRYDAAPPSRLLELSDFLKLFADQPLQFEPGTDQRYSNAGYIVLGLIVERITGEKYRDYVKKHVFGPAGMKNTGFYTLDERVPNRASGYTLHGEHGELTERVPNRRSLPGRPSSAGGAFATAGDLLRFINALTGARLVSQKWTNWTLNNTFESMGPPSIGIAGGAPGLNTDVEVDNGWTVIAMSNFDPPSARELASGAMDIIRGHHVEAENRARVVHRAPAAPQKTELSAPVAVPLTRAAHLLAVDATINGKGPFRFAIDSGAAGMLRVTPDLAKNLGLETVGEARTGDPSGRNVQRLPVVRVDSVEISGARFSGVDAVVTERRADTDGVIGLRLFANLTVTVDYLKPELRLSRDPLPANGEHVVPFTADRGIPVIEIDVAGAPMKVDVDTGSPALLSIPAQWAPRFPFSGEPKVVGKGRTVNNEFEIRAADLKGDLHVAGFTESNPQVDIVDIFPVANVGSRFWRKYILTFDMANERLQLRQ